MSIKTNKHYIFWARRLSDVDHMVPVIYALLKNGISPQSIRYIALTYDKTQTSIFTDPRIKFLNDLGINFESLTRHYFINKIASFQQKKVGNSLVRKIINEVYNRLLFKLIIIMYYLNIFNISRKYKNRGVFIFDHGTSEIYVYAASQAQKNNIKSVTVPHGLVLHRGMINKKHHDYTFPKNSLLNIFDHIVFPDAVSASFHAVQTDKVHIIGSARYSKEWCIKLSHIFGDAHTIRDEKKLNVLFFAEKTGQNINGEWIPWIDDNEIRKILNYFSNDPESNLIIKFHPSIKSSAIYDDYVCTKVIHDSEYNSFQLVQSADVVIATTTSAIMDAFLFNKFVLIPVYASPFKLVFSEFQIYGAILSYTSLIDEVKKIKGRNNDLKDPCDTYKYLLKEFTKEDNQNVLDDYFYFLSNL